MCKLQLLMCAPVAGGIEAANGEAEVMHTWLNTQPGTLPQGLTSSIAARQLCRQHTGTASCATAGSNGSG
jgi:hypothetical protein